MISTVIRRFDLPMAHAFAAAAEGNRGPPARVGIDFHVLELLFYYHGATRTVHRNANS